jgi:very-short-patch-repair endonuclease
MLTKEHKQDIFVYENILNTFYRYYSNLREGIWHKLTKLNQTKAPTNAQAHTYGKNFYLYKAQKLIDRIIFIRFCKEKGALDGDAVLEALNNKFIKGKYNRLKALFTAMNEGNTELGISKFNGGLFAEDKELDSLIIDDEIIDRLVDFYSHDFGSELDVNILGHIFEQSISDLETLTGDNQAKRKKDGVFYTPSFIVDYVIHDTINLWINDKRKDFDLPLRPQVRMEDFIDDASWHRLMELGILKISKEEYKKQREIELGGAELYEEIVNGIIYPSSKKQQEKKQLLEKEAKILKSWHDYAEVLKTIKIIDPACGSGAFLVKVFDYLQREWQHVKKHISIDYSYKHILQNNIYGVDINPASVNITKLSLWLKTAYHKEPLTNLDSNIKNGDSLVDDVSFARFAYEFEGNNTSVQDRKILKKNLTKAGQEESLDWITALTKEDADIESKISLAFNWQKEFESVFKPEGVILGYNDPKTNAKLGFDIILGNPPYVRQELFKDIKPFLQKAYPSVYNGAADLYCYFYEQATNLLKPQGYLGFITSNKWMRASYGQGLRDYLFSNAKIINFIDLGGQKVFDNASVDCNIVVYKKNVLNSNSNSNSKSNLGQENNNNNNYNSFFSNNTNDKARDTNINEDVNVSANQNTNEHLHYKFKASTSLVGHWWWFDSKNLDPKCFNITATDIDRQIKAKMEAIGTPLKDWDVRINYGIKTGFNEAFIIDTKTRNEIIKREKEIKEERKKQEQQEQQEQQRDIKINRGILTGYNEAFIINTKTKEELCNKDPKCEEIIKPILRGRDIDRYGYTWAGLWLINTHNGYKKQLQNIHNNPPLEGGSKALPSGRGYFYNNHADRKNDKNSSDDLKMTQNNPPLEGGSKALPSGRGYNIDNLRHAKQMRKEMTKAELALWKAIKANQLGYKFRRQHPVGNFITDFCCLEKRLVIELDGSQHTEQQEYDNQRTDFLNSAGFKVIRFWNNEFLQHFNDCIDYIVSILNDNITPPQSSYGALTLPQGEGCFKPTEQEQVERIDVEKDYPAIYEHLLKYKDQLEKRTDKGDHWTNLRDCAYYGDFSKEKIVWAETSDKMKFTHIPQHTILDKTCFMINSDFINLKILLPILCSKLIKFYASQIVSVMGKNTMSLAKQHIEKLPIPIIPQDAQKPFEEKAEAMLKLNKDLKTHSTQMVDFLVDKFLPYHKPKSKKQVLEEFEALKTDTDYNKSIPEINRVANHNSSLAKRLSKDTNEALGEEDIYKLKSRLSKWYETGFNLAELFTILQKFNITVPSKEQLEFVNSKITSQFLKYTNILTGLSVYNNPLQTHTPAGKASWGAGACVLYLLSRTIFYYQKCYTKRSFYNSNLTFAEFFNTKAKECQSLQTQISVLDKEIDAMVYNLYGLTQEEIGVVEG